METIDQVIDGWLKEIESLRGFAEGSAKTERIQEHKESAHTALAYRRGIGKFTQMLRETFSINSASDDIHKVSIKHFTHFPVFLSGFTFKRKNKQTGKEETARLTLSSKTVYWQAVLSFFMYLNDQEIVHYDLSVRERLKKSRNKAFIREKRMRKVGKEGAVDACLAKILEVKANSPLRERNIAIWYFMADSGLRIHEVCKLKLRDIDFEAQSGIVIGKDNNQARFYLSDRALKYIQDYFLVRGWGNDPEDPLFAAHDWTTGKKHSDKIHRHLTTNAVRYMIKQTSIEAGVEVWPHAIRHYFVTHVYNRTGGDIVRTQKLARHSKVEMTQHYIDIDEKEAEEVYRRVMEENSEEQDEEQ